jgi:hypothetical protein
MIWFKLDIRCDLYNGCSTPTLLNERRKWKSPIPTKHYYLFLNNIRDYKSSSEITLFFFKQPSQNTSEPIIKLLFQIDFYIVLYNKTH